MGQQSHARVLELMVELEKKIDRATQSQIDILHQEFARQLDDVKALSGE